jgi:hypothetical protein
MGNFVARIRELLGKGINLWLYEIVGLLAGLMDAVVWTPATGVTTTTLTLTNDHNGNILLFTNASGCTVTVPDTLTLGFSCILVQDSAGVVTLAAGGATTFTGPTSVTPPYTVTEQGASMVISKISATRVLVSGAAA